MTKLAEQYGPFSLRRERWPQEGPYEDLRRVLDDIAKFRDEVIKAVNETEHIRLATGNIPAGGSQWVLVTWGTPFRDGNYSVVAMIEGVSGQLETRSIRNKAAASVEILVVNNDGGGIHNEQMNVVGIHD